MSGLGRSNGACYTWAQDGLGGGRVFPGPGTHCACAQGGIVGPCRACPCEVEIGGEVVGDDYPLGYLWLSGVGVDGPPALVIVKVSRVFLYAVEYPLTPKALNGPPVDLLTLQCISVQMLEREKEREEREERGVLHTFS